MTYVTRLVEADIQIKTEEVKPLIGKARNEEFKRYHLPDQHALSSDIETACNKLHEQGFDVVSIMPVQRGGWDKGTTANTNGAWGYGYSLTYGAIITGKKR